MQPRYSHLDPNPGTPLTTLPPSSRRIRSWLARAVRLPGFPLDREVQITGAIHVVTGLEYHNHQFTTRVRSLKALTSQMATQRLGEAGPGRMPSPEEFSTLAELHHEAVAYINRVGQLHFFSKAMGLDAHLAQAAELLPFRNKHTAHRSVDAPRSESDDDIQSQAMAFGFGHSFHGGVLVFGLQSEGTWFSFNMASMHLPLMEQAMAVFEAIFPLPSDA